MQIVRGKSSAKQQDRNNENFYATSSSSIGAKYTELKERRNKVDVLEEDGCCVGSEKNTALFITTCI